MAKRFTDTNKWDKLWFRKLKPEYKCLWDYLITKCDLAGIYDVDLGLASFIIGYQFDEEQVLKTFKGQINVIKSDKWYLTKFVDFQYGTLSDKSKPHLAVIKRLKKYNIELGKSIDTLKDKDKVKVKAKEKDSKLCGKEFLLEMQDKHPDIDVPQEFLKFEDYIASKGKRYKNKRAAFRNWLRSEFVPRNQNLKESNETKKRILENKKKLEERKKLKEQGELDIPKIDFLNKKKKIAGL